MLLKAHEALLEASKLLKILKNLKNDGCDEEKCENNVISQDSELDFVELGSVWQATHYEITLSFHQDDTMEKKCRFPTLSILPRVVPVFNNLVTNEGSSEVEAEFLNHRYIVPKKTCFYMAIRMCSPWLLSWEVSLSNHRNRSSFFRCHLLSLSVLRAGYEFRASAKTEPYNR
ncbi:unnamed protein product [Fraxinus pennsylvanica]|uniref:Uncharacterized protein n=1 Tax=Fraxinus pennsylvanica TaxID=56036 RepID=A0AAD1YXJ2_9LAMI|nr:unnamed protein product [Fraxinus pennsylvanica]